jgi:hypothetical protein
MGRDRATARQQILEDKLGVSLQDMDMTDDRLANVLTMLGDPLDGGALDQALWER